MDYDLSDVGEYINDNPQIPLAAGAVLGHYVRRNVNRARQDAAAIKNGLDALQAQNDKLRRLALKKEQQEKVLAHNREFLFQLSTAIDRILSQDYNLGNYLEIKRLEKDLKNKHLSTASFVDYIDKNAYALVERKVAEASNLFSEKISPEIREQLCEVARWDCLSSLLRRLSDLSQEIRINEEARRATHSGLDVILLKKKWTLLDTSISTVVASILNIHGIAPETLAFASNRDLTQEKRDEFIKDCYQYIRNLLESLSMQPSALPAIRHVACFL